MANKLDITITTTGAEAAAKNLKNLGATANATAAEQARTAKAVALAAKLSGDAVTSEGLRYVQASEKKRTASKDMTAILALERKGTIDNTQSISLQTLAYQRAAKAQLEMAEASKAASTSGGIGAGMIAGLSAAALGAGYLVSKMKEAVTSSLEFAETIHRANLETGLDVGTLSTLHYAAAVTGGDFDKITLALSRMDRSLALAADGNKKMQGYLHLTGEEAKKLAGDQNGAEIVFRKFAATLDNTATAAYRNDLAQAVMGRGGITMIPTIMQLGNSWDTFKQKATAAGVQLDGQTAASLEATQQRLKDMQQKILGAGLAFTQGFTQPLSAMLSAITGGMPTMNLFNDIGQKIGKTFAFVASSLYGAAASYEAMKWAVNKPLAYTEFGESRRRDMAEANQNKADSDIYQAKAVALADIAYGKTKLSAPTSMFTPPAPGSGKSGDDGEGFTGIDPLTRASKAAESQRAALEAAKAAHEKIVRFQEEEKRRNEEMQPKNPDLFGEHSRQMAQMQLSSSGTAMDVSLIQMRTAAELAEAQVHERTGKSLSQHAAAMQLAQIHAGAYATEMGALTKNLDELLPKLAEFQANPMSGENGEELQHKVDELQKQIATLKGTHAVQMQSDASNINNSGGGVLGGATQALQEFALSATNASEVMKELFTSSLNDVNEGLVAMLTTRDYQHKGQWGGIGHDIFTQASGSALKGAEGSLLKGFGIGKVDGSSEGKALWVKMAGIVHAGGKGAESAVTSAAGGMGSVLGFLHITGFDQGTNYVPQDMLAMVHKGETIIPAYQPGGEGGYHHHGDIHIDARGASDPVHTRMLVRDTIRREMPNIVTTTMRAHADYNSRVPASRRI